MSKRRFSQNNNPNIITVPTMSFCDGSPCKKVKLDKNPQISQKVGSRLCETNKNTCVEDCNSIVKAESVLLSKEIEIKHLNQPKKYDRAEDEIERCSMIIPKSDNIHKKYNIEKCVDLGCVQSDKCTKKGNKEIIETTTENPTESLEHVLSDKKSEVININVLSKGIQKHRIQEQSQDNKIKNSNDNIINLVNQPITNINISNSNKLKTIDPTIKHTDIHKINETKIAEYTETTASRNVEFNKALSESSDYKCINKHQTAQNPSVNNIDQIIENFDLNKLNYCRLFSTNKNVDISDIREQLNSKNKLKENALQRNDDLGTERRNCVKDKILKTISKKKVKKINIKIDLIFNNIQSVSSANKTDGIYKENESMESNCDLSFLDDINVDEIIESLNNCENDCNIKESTVSVAELSSSVNKNKNTSIFLTEGKSDDHKNVIKNTKVKLKIDQIADFEIIQSPNLINKCKENEAESWNCSKLRNLKQSSPLMSVVDTNINEDSKEIYNHLYTTIDQKYEDYDVPYSIPNKCPSHIVEANTQLKNNCESFEHSEVSKGIKETCLEQNQTNISDSFNHNVTLNAKIDIHCNNKEIISIIENIIDTLIQKEKELTNTKEGEKHIVHDNEYISKTNYNQEPNTSPIEYHLSNKTGSLKLISTEQNVKSVVEGDMIETELSKPENEDRVLIFQKNTNDNEINDDAKLFEIDIESAQKDEKVFRKDDFDSIDNKTVVELVSNVGSLYKSLMNSPSESAFETEISNVGQNLTINRDCELNINKTECNITQIQINNIPNNVKDQRTNITYTSEEKSITTDKTNTDNISQEQCDHPSRLEIENCIEKHKTYENTHSHNIRKSVNNVESVIINAIPESETNSIEMENKILQSKLIPKEDTDVSKETKTPTLSKEERKYSKNINFTTNDMSKELNDDTSHKKLSKSLESNSTLNGNLKHKQHKPTSKTDNNPMDNSIKSSQNIEVTITSTSLEDKILVGNLKRRMLEYFNTPYDVSTIRSGRFSKIFKCRNSHGSQYVIKVNDLHNHKLGIERECMLRNIQEGIPPHAIFNCVRLINGFSVIGHRCFLMEYYPNNLYQALREHGKSFHIDLVQDLSRQLVTAVLLLRVKNIVHSDIKPTHILLNSTYNTLKLCGFDRAYYINAAKLLPNVGTKNYRAPEIILGHSAGYSIDVWSTALVMFEMATGRILFPGTHNNDILYKQICTLGPVPSIIIRDSVFREKHFSGTNFFRRVGVRDKNIILITNIQRNSRLFNYIIDTYKYDWACVRNETQKRFDLVKLCLLHNLLQEMLNMNPNTRLSIENVCTNQFIFRVNV